MGDGFWSTGCRSDVEYYGAPGVGAWYRSRFGTYSVTGGVYQTFAARGYECHVEPFLGAPVKPYGWIAEMNYGRGCWGQWFENGAIGYHDGRWNVMYGRYGQTGGMTLAAVAHKVRRRRPRRNAERPPEHDDLVLHGQHPIPGDDPAGANERWITGRLATDARHDTAPKETS